MIAFPFQCISSFAFDTTVSHIKKNTGAHQGMVSCTSHLCLVSGFQNTSERIYCHAKRRSATSFVAEIVNERLRQTTRYECVHFPKTPFRLICIRRWESATLPAKQEHKMPGSITPRTEPARHNCVSLFFYPALIYCGYFLLVCLFVEPVKTIFGEWREEMC